MSQKSPECPECCTEMKPLLTSFYCPVCEGEDEGGQWFEVIPVKTVTYPKEYRHPSTNKP